MVPKIDQNRGHFGVLGPLGASWGRLGASWGRLGPHLGRLGPHFGPKVPTHRRSHNRTKKKLKNKVQKESSAAEGLTLWGAGKTADSEKSIAKHSGKR